MAPVLAHAYLAALLDHRTLAPHAVGVHPTDEHLLPIFTALGAGAVCGRATRVTAYCSVIDRAASGTRAKAGGRVVR